MERTTPRRSYRAALYRGVVLMQSRVARRRLDRPGVLFEYPPLQSPLEERANAAIHALAAVASLFASIALMAAVAPRGDALLTFACALYAASLVGVFTMSTLSHTVGLPRLRQLFRTLDQAAIYLLTVGTFTPFALRYLAPFGWGWLIVLMWGMALLAVWDKLRGSRVNSISVVFNVVLGWTPLLAVKPLLAHMPAGCLALVVGSGLLYMVGVLFLCYDERRPFFHAVWHLFVVAASAGMYAGIIKYVVWPL